MTDVTARRERDPLTRVERSVATVGAVALLGIALWMVVNPPDRTVALAGCENAADGCLVSVDSDATTFAAAIAAFAAGIGLIALLGVRFTSVKAGAVELSSRYDATTAGLPTAAPQPPPERAAAGDKRGAVEAHDANFGAAESPVEVQLVTGLGTELGRVPVAVASLTTPMNRSQAEFLRDYQSARRASQKGWFLIHILGPAKSPGQRHSVAIKVSPIGRRRERCERHASTWAEPGAIRCSKACVEPTDASESRQRPTGRFWRSVRSNSRPASACCWTTTATSRWAHSSPCDLETVRFRRRGRRDAVSVTCATRAATASPASTRTWSAEPP